MFLKKMFSLIFVDNIKGDSFLFHMLNKLINS